jgi:hypothetical protein
LLISSLHASDCSRVPNIGGAKCRDRFAQGNPIDLSNRARLRLFSCCAVCPES